jgi:hypothetical protein
MATALGREACALLRQVSKMDLERWQAWVLAEEAARLWEERRVLRRTIRVLRTCEVVQMIGITPKRACLNQRPRRAEGEMVTCFNCGSVALGSINGVYVSGCSNCCPALMPPPRGRWVRPCGRYLGDNDGTCPQLTCIRVAGHDGLCDNVAP